MFEELQLVVEMVDRAHALSLSISTPRARCQDRQPQQPYENQQDQNRHSPDDLPSLFGKSLMKRSFQVVDGGEMHSADLVGTSPLTRCTNDARVNQGK
jgi:hypothetical protein